MVPYEQLLSTLPESPKTWLVTGAAGFIGSNLTEALLKLDQRVVGLDNFATGHQRNLDEVQRLVTPEQWARFHFINGDIRKPEDGRQAMTWQAPGSALPPTSGNVDYVLHQAALGSVPRSLKDPITSNETNVIAFLNMLVPVRDAKVKSFNYAAGQRPSPCHHLYPWPPAGAADLPPGRPDEPHQRATTAFRRISK